MGLFSKKKKTSVSTEVVDTVLTKIVKLSYIQSVAINGESAKVTDFVQETGASKTDPVTLDNTKSESTAYKIGNSKNTLVGGIILRLPVVGLAAGVVSGLLGKKTSTNVTAATEQSGWSLVKTWTQPQFDIIRYAIGIKELSISQFSYQPVSEIISKPWSSPKEINKVSLLVDQYIPSQFPPGVYIEYYVKSDTKDSNWIRINPVGLPTQYDAAGTIVPRIINFNTERPVSSNIEDAYVSISEPVKSIRFRALLKRPEGQDTYTPVLRSYRLKISLRNGL